MPVLDEGFRKQFDCQDLFIGMVNLEQQRKSILRFHSSTLESGGAVPASEREHQFQIPKDFSKADNGMFPNTTFYIFTLKPSLKRIAYAVPCHSLLLLEIRVKCLWNFIFKSFTRPSLVLSLPHPSGSQRQIHPCKDKILLFIEAKHENQGFRSFGGSQLTNFFFS